MKIRTLVIAVTVLMLATGSALAQMGGGGGMGGGGMGGGDMGGGIGYGKHGSGGMVPRMMENTISYGYLDVLNSVTSPVEAREVIQAFIDSSNSALQISELWEYETVYKAELSDTTGAKAFDLIADKSTGVVSPEMGMSMMRNASYGKGLYKTQTFKKNLTITPDQAQTDAQAFIDKNGLGYTIGVPEIYPGYYKFHTADGSGYGMDIMINGYNGRIWMETILGVPLGKY